MLNFTRQERYVIYFLAITLGIGAIFKLVRNKQLATDSVPTRFYEEQQQFEVISEQMNQRDVLLVDSTRSGDEPQINSGTVLNINLNTAEISELTELPGIGPALAKRIRAYTDQHGPFKNKSDLVLVKGIGEKLYARIQGLVTTD